MHEPAGLDVPMIYMYDLLEGKTNVYTMDYRGTGRSEQLTCQASAPSSLNGGMDPSDVPECAQELEDKYGDLAAFSTTSAAKDLVSFISYYTNDFSSTIYGVGYGTNWVESIMHLDPPEVTGYVLDSVTTTSGVSSDKFFNLSSVDINAAVPLYCAFSKEKSPVCDKLKLDDYDGNGIIYERDEYWNKHATIPNQASVLLMSSKLDPAAPYQYAKHLFGVFDGENKELVTFENTAGSNLIDRGTYEYMCGSIILASYVQNNGNLAKLDKSCALEKTALNWTTLIEYQYGFLSTDDAFSSDYQDAAQICLLWYLFGRASDLALLRKPNISIDAGNVLFVRFIRMKTSEEQGLSLFPGTEFETCPMLAMALAMLIQTAHQRTSSTTYPQDQAAITLSPDVPLLDILDHPVDTTALGAPSAAGVEKTPTVYSQVNRVLDRIAAAAGVTAALTSHSFRRGGAQHANGSGELTARQDGLRGGFPHLTDAQFESVRNMTGIFGGDALRNLAAATPAEQVERIEAFDTYERGLIAHVQGLQAPAAEMKPAQPKPLRLKVNPYEGKEGENLHFWVREVELAMDAALISTERLRVAFALSNLGGRTKTWAYTREATTPGCFTTWAQLCQQLRAAFIPANYESR
ncbi:Gag protein [Phytophthora palmivora]|uniref:Gag protein n=1 Tax=Phytophthora palmivora TaxID=4796 RepID=A0A2P4XKU2_9STRA|nr:Gag protein [Phytophthora palmivora]